MCDTAFSVGTGGCTSDFTDMICITSPQGLINANGAIQDGNSLIKGAQLPLTAKGLVVGGMRFWLKWAISNAAFEEGALGTALAALGPLIWQLHLVWFIAKIPLNPDTMAPVYVPLLHRMRGSSPALTGVPMEGDVQYDLLWTKPENLVLANNPDADPQASFAVNNDAGAGIIYSSTGTGNTFPPYISQQHPHRVKVKRRLNEMDALWFGVSSHSSGIIDDPVLTYPISIDLFGQLALKEAK